MRANITYSVDMENIPQEVSRITTSEAAGLSDHFYEIQAALGEKNFTEVRNKIVSARQSLGNADIRLFELDQIMASYIEMINQGEEGGSPEEESPEELEDNENG